MTTTFRAAVNPNASDVLLRSQLLKQNGEAPDVANSAAASPEDALIRGWEVRLANPASPVASTPPCYSLLLQYWSRLQCKDGHWAGDYGGAYCFDLVLLESSHMTHPLALLCTDRPHVLTSRELCACLFCNFASHLLHPTTPYVSVVGVGPRQ